MMTKLLNIFKAIVGFFKKAEQVADTIEDKMNMALQLGFMARDIFSDALDQLKEANDKLDKAQREAEQIIREHQEIVTIANMNKINNNTTITNIERLVGVDQKIQNGGN